LNAQQFFYAMSNAAVGHIHQRQQEMCNIIKNNFNIIITLSSMSQRAMNKKKQGISAMKDLRSKF